MKKMNLDVRKGEKGFTLVELAIVMIIIGLLLGGVLKGQDLIKNAQVSSVVSEIKGYDAAINTFRDAYAGYPGDLRTPNTRLPGCTAAPCSSAGNGNGRIGAFGANSVFTATTVGTENLAAWAQMEAAGVINAVDGQNNVNYGSGLPESAFGVGGYQISYHSSGNITGIIAASGHYLQLALGAGATNSAIAANSAAAGFIEATLAARIDRKMDNGVPTTGSVREVAGATCTNGAGATATYNEAVNAADCALVIGLNN